MCKDSMGLEGLSLIGQKSHAEGGGEQGATEGKDGAASCKRVEGGFGLTPSAQC